jgi:hypothetical protein
MLCGCGDDDSQELLRYEYINDIIQNNRNIKELVLEFSFLKKLPRNVGKKLTKLKMLDLTGNSLSKLPSTITNLTKLDTLLLCFNSFEKFPNQICMLTKLTTLRLRSNQITTIPCEISQLQNLDFFDMMSNKIESLPSELGSMKSLKYLLMKSNPLKSLPISLLNLEKIKGFCCDFDEEPLSIPKELCYKKWFEHSSYFIGSVTHSFDKLDKTPSGRRPARGSSRSPPQARCRRGESARRPWKGHYSSGGRAYRRCRRPTLDRG